MNCEEQNGQTARRQTTKQQNHQEGASRMAFGPCVKRKKEKVMAECMTDNNEIP